MSLVPGLLVLASLASADAGAQAALPAEGDPATAAAPAALEAAAPAWPDAGAPDVVSAAAPAVDGGAAPWADVVSAATPAAGADGGSADDDRARGQTVITGTRTPSRREDAVVPTEVITRAQIESAGVRDLGQLLTQQPGVDVVYTFRGAGIRLQGLDPEYVLILVDGERVTGRVGTTIDLSRFSLRDVERIEIVKGPAAALYGADAIGGVVNLITRRVTRPWEASLRLQAGNSFKGGQNDEWDVRAHGGMKRGPFEVRAGGGYRGGRGYDLDPTDAATTGPGAWRYDGDLAVLFAPTPRFEAKGRVAYLRRDSEAVDVAPSGAVFDRRGRLEQLDASLGARARPTSSTDLSARVRFGFARDQLLQDQRGAVFLDTYSQNIDRLWEGELQLDQKLGQHLLTVGAAVLTEGLRSPRLTNLEAFRYRFSGFVQDAWDTVIPGTRTKLTVLPGFRVDYDSQFGGAPSPRLALKADPSPRVSLRAAWGMGFRPPSFQELYLLFENSAVGYLVQGNPDLEPEHSHGLNLSFDWKPPLEGWVVSLSAFRTWILDLIAVNTDQPVDPDNPALFGYANVARAYTQGVEASARIRISSGTYLDLGYMLLDARDELTGRYLEGRAAHRANASLSAKYRTLGLEGTVRATVTSPRPFYEDSDGDGVEDTVWSPVAADLDVQVGYRYRSLFTIFVGVTNLIGTGDARWVPRPPRQFYAGAQIQY